MKLIAKYLISILLKRAIKKIERHIAVTYEIAPKIYW